MYKKTSLIGIRLVLVLVFLQNLTKNTVKSRAFKRMKGAILQKVGSDSEPAESAFTNEQVSQAWLFAKKEQQRRI